MYQGEVEKHDPHPITMFIIDQKYMYHFTNNAHKSLFGESRHIIKDILAYEKLYIIQAFR